MASQDTTVFSVPSLRTPDDGSAEPWPLQGDILTPNDPRYNYLLLNLREAGLTGKALSWGQQRQLELLGDLLALLKQGDQPAAGPKTVAQVSALCNSLGLAYDTLNFPWPPTTYLRAARRAQWLPLALRLHANRMPVPVSLEEDYENMLRYADVSPTHRRVITHFFGMGSTPVNLQHAGAEVGLTRERARQLSETFLSVVRELPRVFFPVVTAAHNALVHSGPRMVREVGPWLVDRGFSQSSASGEGFVKLLLLLDDMPMPQQLRLLASGGGRRDQALTAAVERTLRALTARYGATTQPAVLKSFIQDRPRKVRISAKELTSVLDQVPGLQRLHGPWFRLPGGKRDRVARTLSKLSCYGRRFTLAELHGAWAKTLRYPHAEAAFLMPPRVLQELLLQGEWKLGTDGLWSRKLSAPIAVLTDIERRLVEVLQASSQLLSRSSLLVRLKELGSKFAPSYVSLYLSISPLWQREKAGYRLLGVPA